MKLGSVRGVMSSRFGRCWNADKRQTHEEWQKRLLVGRVHMALPTP